VSRAGWAASAFALTALLTGCTGGASAVSAPTTHSTAAVVVPLKSCPEQPARPARGTTTLPALSFSCAGGGSLDFRRAPGVPTVVNLWGSWCAPCRDELPVLQQLADAAGNRVHVLGVITKDGLPQAASFAADAKVTFPSAVDGEGSLMAAVGLNALPVTYFLDAGGGVAFLQVGPVKTLAQAKALVATHLGVRL
jgi:cytochrome c biogenesis protein CcmG/thiol:disulfide interchange protein DsbE